MFGLLGGLISGIGSAVGAYTNNQNQWKMLRMNQDFAREMADKQMQYNSEMYERQLEDYSPSAIRQRLEEADLNAPLIMSGGAGVASSAGHSPSMSAPNVQGTYNGQNVGAGVSVGVDSFARVLSTLTQKDNIESDTRLKDATARSQEIDNNYKEQQILSNLAYLAANTKDIDARRNFQEMLNQVQTQTLNDQVSRYRIENSNLSLQGQYLSAQAAFVKVQTDIGSKQLKWMDKEKQYQLALIASQMNLNDAQAAEACSRKILADAQAQGVQISNKVAQATAWDTVKLVRAERTFKEWQSVTQQNNSGPQSAYGVSPWLGVGLDVLNGVTGFIGAAKRGSQKAATKFQPGMSVVGPTWYR